MNEQFFNIFPKLETERFILRRIEEKDQNDIFALYSDNSILIYQGITALSSKEEALKKIKLFQNGFDNKYFIKFGIEDKRSGSIIGILSLHSFDRCNNSAKIGFILLKSAWNKGIMTEVGNKVIQYCFEHISLNRLEAFVHPQNTASLKLCAKLQFIQEGILHEAAYSKCNSQYEDRIILGLIKNNFLA